MILKFPWTSQHRQKQKFLLFPSLLLLSVVILRSSHSLVVRTTIKKRNVFPSIAVLFQHHPVHGERVSFEPDDIVSGATSISVVETEPGIRLRCLEYYNSDRRGSLLATSGNQSSNVILLLHGFPDVPMTWNGVAKNLIYATFDGEHREKIDGGRNSFVVVCPELRGYSSTASSSPNENGKGMNANLIESFSRESIVRDIDALRRYYCGEQGSFRLLAGHDWGGCVVWSVLEDQELLHQQPRIAQTAAILNLPHPLVFAENIVRWKQLRKSWYMFAFQIPIVSEWLLSRNEASYLREAVIHNLIDRGAKHDGDIKLYYSRTLSRPGFINNPIRYYRAAAIGLWGSFGACAPSYPKIVQRFVSLARTIARALYGIGSKSDNVASDREEGNDHNPFSVVLQTPVLVLWGSKDPYLGEELATPPTHLVPKLSGPVVFENSGHWVHWDDEKEVSNELLKFISENSADPS